MKIGFIGLGTMGQHMAWNLIEAGHELVVFDLRKEAADRHLKAGAVWADSPWGVADQTDVVFTSLPGPPEVESVATGEAGLLAAMGPGKVYIDLSTNSPTVVRKLHGLFAAKGAEVLDAPVSGGPRGARTKKLSLWVGGDKATYDRLLPVIQAIGDKPDYVGPIGAGSVAKLVHNCAGYAIQTALAEVFTMGVKAGVEPLALYKAVRNGAQGRRRTFDGMIENFLPHTFDPASFMLKLAHKDVTLATALGREVNVPMRVANLALADLTEALNRGWGDRDSRVAMVLQEERAGVEVRVPADQLADLD